MSAITAKFRKHSCQHQDISIKSLVALIRQKRSPEEDFHLCMALLAVKHQQVKSIGYTTIKLALNQLLITSTWCHCLAPLLKEWILFEKQAKLAQILGREAGYQLYKTILNTMELADQFVINIKRLEDGFLNPQLLSFISKENQALNPSTLQHLSLPFAINKKTLWQVSLSTEKAIYQNPGQNLQYSFYASSLQDKQSLITNILKPISRPYPMHYNNALSMAVENNEPLSKSNTNLKSSLSSNLRKGYNKPLPPKLVKRNKNVQK